MIPLTEIILLFLIMALIIMIVEVATVMFKLTGLEREVARFQAISLITASGYTTSESELVVRHPVRRKIAMFLMVLGPIVLAFIISIIIRLLGRGFTGAQDFFVAASALLLIRFFFRNRTTASLFNRYLEQQLAKQPSLRRHPVEEILQLDDDHTVAEVILSNPEVRFVGKHLSESRLRDRGVLVLSIRRDGRVIHTPRGSDELRLNDTLLVYGRSKQISELIEQIL